MPKNDENQLIQLSHIIAVLKPQLDQWCLLYHTRQMQLNPQLQVQLTIFQRNLIKQNGSYFHILNNKFFLLPTTLYLPIIIFYFTMHRLTSFVRVSILCKSPVNGSALLFPNIVLRAPLPLRI